MRNLLAQEPIGNPALGPGLQAKKGVEFFQSFLPAAVGFAMVVGAVIFLFMIVTGAITWITSGGDKEAVNSARGRITNAVVGFLVLASVFVVITFLENFFNINILTLDIGPLYVR